MLHQGSIWADLQFDQLEQSVATNCLQSATGGPGLKAGLALLFGAGLADPNNTAMDGVQGIVVGDDLDRLSAP
jgi:hypothetical protein